MLYLYLIILSKDFRASFYKPGAVSLRSAATKLKNQNVKCKISDSRQAGITLYYLKNYVSYVEKTRTKNKKLEVDG